MRMPLRLKDADGKPSWPNILSFLVAVLIKKGITKDNKRGEPEEIAGSIIGSVCRIIERTRGETGSSVSYDEEFEQLLFATLWRKLDTAKKHFRNGHGRSVRFSEIGEEGFQFASEIPDHLNPIGSEGGIPFDPEIESLFDTFGELDPNGNAIAFSESDREILRKLSASASAWLNSQLTNVDPLNHDIFLKKLTGSTQYEISNELDISEGRVRRGLRAIEEALRREDGEGSGELDYI